MGLFLLQIYRNGFVSSLMILMYKSFGFEEFQKKICFYYPMDPPPLPPSSHTTYHPMATQNKESVTFDLRTYIGGHAVIE
jgi:hypothetical protein